MIIDFYVNDEPVHMDIPADMTLSRVLREKLFLKGTKEGCGKGDCGACSVLLNGRLVNSCLILAGKLQGARVTTIEGLAKNGALHPIQEAFIKAGAVQCGFCTPGMIMATYALLQDSDRLDESAIRKGLSGNLCRCTGYVRIVEAVKLAAQYVGKDGATDDR